MPREVSGLRLFLHSSATDRSSIHEIGRNRRYMRLGSLLLTVLGGIFLTNAVGTAAGGAVAYLQKQSELVQNTTVILISSAIVLNSSFSSFLLLGSVASVHSVSIVSSLPFITLRFAGGASRDTRAEVLWYFYLIYLLKN